MVLYYISMTANSISNCQTLSIRVIRVLCHQGLVIVLGIHDLHLSHSWQTRDRPRASDKPLNDSLPTSIRTRTSNF